MKLNFDYKSFSLFIIILIIEILIALFVKDKIIRPYGGDVLVIILIYFFIKSFFNIKPVKLILFVLLFACFVEISQYFHIVQLLGLENNKVMSTVIGNSFSWGDILCYIIGGVICFVIEKRQSILTEG